MSDDLPTPLDFLKAVYCNEGLPLNTRLRAASEAAKYIHPRLAVVASVRQEDMATMLENALRRAAKVIEDRSKVVEGEIIQETVSNDAVSQVELPDHSKPFAHDNKSRFRRF